MEKTVLINLKDAMHVPKLRFFITWKLHPMKPDMETIIESHENTFVYVKGAALYLPQTTYVLLFSTTNEWNYRSPISHIQLLQPLPVLISSYQMKYGRNQVSPVFDKYKIRRLRNCRSCLNV